MVAVYSKSKKWQEPGSRFPDALAWGGHLHPWYKWILGKCSNEQMCWIWTYSSCILFIHCVSLLFLMVAHFTVWFLMMCFVWFCFCFSAIVLYWVVWMPLRKEFFICLLRSSENSASLKLLFMLISYIGNSSTKQVIQMWTLHIYMMQILCHAISWKFP